MAKKKKGSRRRKQKKVSIGLTAGWGSYGIRAAKSATESAYTNKQKLDYVITNLTGFRYGSANTQGDGFAWDAEVFKETWTGPGLGTLMHILGKKLRLNKYINKIPFVGKYLEL